MDDDGAVARAASRTEDEARPDGGARGGRSVARCCGGARWLADGGRGAASRTEEEARRDGGERDGAGEEFGAELVDGGGGTGNFGSLTA